MKIKIIICVIGLLFIGAFIGYCVGVMNADVPVKAKIVTELGCVETTLTIEEFYFQQKMFAKMGIYEQMKSICN